MTKLNEGDFLERLMPYLHRGFDDGKDPCPDSESLVAFGEGTLDATRSEHIRDHFAHCAACNEIHKRLLPFESDVQPSQLEWQNAEKRLGNWIESLLQEEIRPTEQIRKAGFWQKLRRLTAFQPVRYGTVGVVITLAVAAGVTMMRPHRPSSVPEPSPVAAVTPPAAPAHASPLLKGKHEQLEIESSGEDQLNGPQTLVLMADAGKNHAEAVSLVASFHIESGTVIALRIGSIRQRQDGSFIFQGPLTEPLRQRGTELLPRGTLVTGHSIPLTNWFAIETLGGGPEPKALESAPTRFYALQGSRANVTIPDKSDETLSKGKTVEFQFVLRSKYQIQSNP